MGTEKSSFLQELQLCLIGLVTCQLGELLWMALRACFLKGYDSKYLELCFAVFIQNGTAHQLESSPQIPLRAVFLPLYSVRSSND